MFYFLMMLFFLCLVSFCLNRKHLLSLLLTLEYISLVLYLVMSVFVLYFKYEVYFLMVFLTVCGLQSGFSLVNFSLYSTYSWQWLFFFI